MQSPHGGEWSGVRGRFYAWLFSTYTRKALELLVFGNYWTDFRRERQRRIRTGDECVVDLGAGSGNLTLPIARKLRHGQVIGIDPATEMTDFLGNHARRVGLHERVRIVNGDATHTGLADASVDWVVSCNCMHENARPAEIWAETHRILKPGGAAFIVDFRDWHGFHGDGAHGPFSVMQMHTLFVEAGFRNITVTPRRHFAIGIGEK